jgi:hypothetical protein
MISVILECRPATRSVTVVTQSVTVVTQSVAVVTLWKEVNKYKCKTIPVTGRGVLRGCEMLRIPHCLDNQPEDGGEVASFKHRLRSTLQKYFLFIFNTQCLVKILSHDLLLSILSEVFTFLRLDYFCVFR